MSMTEIVIKKKTKRGEDNHRVISVRLSNDLLVQIEAAAKDSNHSRNELINVLLTEAVKNVVIKD